MLPIILIVLGIALILLGITGLVSLSIQPFFKAIRVVFFHSTDDLKYDSVQGKQTLEREYKVLSRAFLFFFVTGVVCLGAGLYLKYAPRGNDSFLSEFVEGAAAGNDTINNQGQNHNTAGNTANAVASRYSTCISISGKTIFFNEQELGGTEELEEYLKTLDRGKTIFLNDDFAVSPVFHKVEELLDRYGMNYETESDE